MRRLRAIIDGDDMHYRHEEKYQYDPELREAYECGRKQGWREAMHEVEGYGERRGYDERRDYRGLPPMYREDRDWDEYDERRRRNRRTGRYE